MWPGRTWSAFTVPVRLGPGPSTGFELHLLLPRSHANERTGAPAIPALPSGQTAWDPNKPCSNHLAHSNNLKTQLKPAVAGLFTSEEAAGKFADVLGLTPTCFTRRKGRCEDATDKLRNLWTALMPCEYEDPTDPIISNYLAKYMRGPLGSVLYEFFVDLVLSRNHPGESITGLLIFSTYAYEYRSQIRPLLDDTLEKLKASLRTRAEEILEVIRCKSLRRQHKKRPTIIRSHERDLYHITSCETMQLTLTRKGTFVRYAALHENGEGLTRYECARRRTVAYCCRVHQKMDWSPPMALVKKII
ncbi:hypothetical protein DFH07DRAFT_778915 [Mycena maculata]|uniref:Uncharacterized protein n=1 Tax=Mycena maculata TaxID=230809 RepID=A0AAD7ICK3_9AGAR|nr:hypothetical protein DFH07DRAFT_778915 [Mycena maculata]